MTCPNCNCSVDDYSVTDDGRKVCTQCGCVLEDNTLEVIPPAFNDEQSRPLFKSVAPWKLLQNYEKENQITSVGRTLGRKMVKRIIQTLDASDIVLKEATDIFNRAYELREFRYKQLPSKELIAACSVFIACRKYDRPITIIDFCGRTRCNMLKFGQMLLRMTRLLNITVKSIDIVDLAKAKYGSARLEEAVSKRALNILDICMKVQITEGINRENLVTASAYLSWLSFKPSSRWKINLESFCKERGLPAGRTVNHVSNILAGVLYRLATQLPWVRKETLTLCNVAMYTDDVKEYNNTLLSDSQACYEASFVESLLRNDSGTEAGSMNNEDTLIATNSSNAKISNDVMPRIDQPSLFHSMPAGRSNCKCMLGAENSATDIKIEHKCQFKCSTVTEQASLVPPLDDIVNSGVLNVSSSCEKGSSSSDFLSPRSCVHIQGKISRIVNSVCESQNLPNKTVPSSTSAVSEHLYMLDVEKDLHSLDNEIEYTGVLSKRMRLSDLKCEKLLENKVEFASVCDNSGKLGSRLVGDGNLKKGNPSDHSCGGANECVPRELVCGSTDTFQQSVHVNATYVLSSADGNASKHEAITDVNSFCVPKLSPSVSELDSKSSNNMVDDNLQLGLNGSLSEICMKNDYTDYGIPKISSSTLVIDSKSKINVTGANILLGVDGSATNLPNRYDSTCDNVPKILPSVLAIDSPAEDNIIDANPHLRQDGITSDILKKCVKTSGGDLTKNACYDFPSTSMKCRTATEAMPYNTAAVKSQSVSDIKDWKQVLGTDLKRKPLSRKGVRKGHRYQLELTNNARLADAVLFGNRVCSKKWRGRDKEECDEADRKDEIDVKKLITHDLDSTELCEMDITEEELSQYILTIDS